MAGEKRRNIESVHIPTKQEIINTLYDPVHQDKPIEHKAFVAILYLTGARIREIIPYKAAEWRKRIKNTKMPDGSIKKEKIHYWFERNWKGLTNRQIIEKEELGNDKTMKTICLFENVPTEKRRGELYWDKQNQRWIEKSRTVWRKIPVSQEKDGALLDLIADYSKTIQNQDAPLFPWYKTKGRRIITSFDPEWFPHLMRHARLTHLAVEEDFKDMELKQLTAWVDTRPSEKYVHLQWKDIVRKHF